MSEKIKFPCVCGKSLSADSKLAGKKAKCPNCGQVVQIPSPERAFLTNAVVEQAKPTTTAKPKPTPAARSTPPPAANRPSRPPVTTAPAAVTPAKKKPEPLPDLAAKSLWEEDTEYDFERNPTTTCPACAADMPADAVVCVACGHNLKTGQKLAAPTVAAADRPGIFTRLLSQPWWMYAAAFAVYALVVGLISIVSAPVSAVLVVPFGLLGLLMVVVGFFGRLGQHASRGPSAQFWLLAILLALVGLRGSSAGFIAGRVTGEHEKKRPSKRLASWPGTLIKLGGLCLLFSVGVGLLVGKLLGAWSDERMRPQRFAQPDRGAWQGPPGPPVNFPGPARPGARGGQPATPPFTNPDIMIARYGAPDREESSVPDEPAPIPMRVLIYEQEHLRAVYVSVSPPNSPPHTVWAFQRFQDTTDNRILMPNEAFARLKGRKR